jgi:hypothetical protein
VADPWRPVDAGPARAGSARIRPHSIVFVAGWKPVAMHPSLRAVTTRLSHVQERVAHLFERDEEFRELCEEYLCCTETMSRIESSAGSSRAMLHEYSALLLRLERELLRYLEEH